MRNFLEEAGSSDEGEGEEGSGRGQEGEEDKSMADIDAYIEKMKKLEAAEEKR